MIHANGENHDEIKKTDHSGPVSPDSPAPPPVIDDRVATNKRCWITVSLTNHYKLLFTPLLTIQLRFQMWITLFILRLPDKIVK